MPVAEIIAIGTELLLGEIQDTNTRFLARSLRDSGVDLYRTMVVGDNPERISQIIQESLQRSQIVITTGGLGPTVDDPTRQAVADAVGVSLEFRPELWDQIQARFQRYARQATENNRRQAYIPSGAIPVENPVGTAPAFIFETPLQSIICLPGVPREMEYLFENKISPYLRQRFDLHGIIKARVLHTAGMGESQVDALVGDLETANNPTVGLLAHAGQVDVRITAKANSVAEADQLIETMEKVCRERLGDAIYGIDSETLPDIVFSSLQTRQYSIAMIECGLQGELVKHFKGNIQAKVIDECCQPDDLKVELEQAQAAYQAQVLLGASLQRGPEKQVLTLHLIQPGSHQEITRSYGGPPTMSTAWAANTALDFLRRSLLVDPVP
jgi:nicotinamide-nucleotide amidase